MILDYQVYGEESVSAELLRFGDRIEDPAGAWRAIADELREIGTERFDVEGPGWEKLAESTVAQKAREGKVPEILHRELDLMASLSEPGGDNIEIIKGDELIFGTSDPKAVFHQEGRGNNPVRRVLDIGADERRRATRIMQHFLVEGWA